MWIWILLGGVVYVGDVFLPSLGLEGVGEVSRGRDLVFRGLLVGVDDVVDRWRWVSWYSLSPFGGGFCVF